MMHLHNDQVERRESWKLGCVGRRMRSITHSNKPGLTNRSIDIEGCSCILLFDLKSHRSYKEIATNIGKLYSLSQLLSSQAAD